MYNNLHDAQMRLDGTIIRIGRWPIKVSGIDTRYGDNDEESMMLFYKFLKSNREDQTELIEENVNVEPVPLGYVNLDTESIYVQRIPDRRWKQGLCEDGLHAIGRASLIREVFRNGACLADTILNIYPSLEMALDTIQHPQAISIAFSRKFGLLKGRRGPLKLMNIGREVGTIENNVPVLSSAFNHLAELLEEEQK